jgi:glycosyltransferase involved in cell wall biosynthesis
VNILQACFYDNVGGASRIAWYLLEEYGRRGHDSRLAVGRKVSGNPAVFEIPNDDYRNRWVRAWARAEKAFREKWRLRFLPGMARLLAMLGEPGRCRDLLLGRENFGYPATSRLLDIAPRTPHVLHAHNLHGHSFYFDLGALSGLSARTPTFVTLHDEWLMTGHCAYSLGCERWRTGCGRCPDLSRYPRILRDATDYNWRQKRSIYRASRLHIAAPSRWLLRRAEESILRYSMTGSRVIHNGVDLSVFRPGDRRAARAALQFPADARIVLFVGHLTRSNPFKDYATVRDAFLRFAASSTKGKNILLCVGEKGKDEYMGSTLIRNVGYMTNMRELAAHYSAADVLAHAAHMDNFPNTILEALGCGTPVVGTAVGGVQEQIDDGVTGFLVPPRDPGAMAARLSELCRDRDLWRRMSGSAADAALRRFGIERMADEYLDWYREVLERPRTSP